MVNYSDVIVQKGETPVITFYPGKRVVAGSIITVKYRQNVIFKGVCTKSEEKIPLPLLNENLSEYTVEISYENAVHTFPVSVLTLEKDEPYIICDIDFTISATTLYEYITSNILHMKTITNSSEILNLLSSRYRIIYLTGRHFCYTKLTKLWLKKNHFPAGPILSRKNESSFHLKNYKIKALDSIVAISKNGIGIGDLKSDTQAYLAHNIPAVKITHPILFGSNKDYIAKGNNIYKVKSWCGIENLFKDKFIK